jgi:hypothetical protein
MSRKCLQRNCPLLFTLKSRHSRSFITSKHPPSIELLKNTNMSPKDNRAKFSGKDFALSSTFITETTEHPFLELPSCLYDNPLALPASLFLSSEKSNGKNKEKTTWLRKWEKRQHLKEREEWKKAVSKAKEMEVRLNNKKLKKSEKRDRKRWAKDSQIEK